MGGMQLGRKIWEWKGHFRPSGGTAKGGQQFDLLVVTTITTGGPLHNISVLAYSGHVFVIYPKKAAISRT